MDVFRYNHHNKKVKGKGKAVPLQAWSGQEGSRKLRFPDYMTTAQDCGKFVSPKHRLPLPRENAPGTHFCDPNIPVTFIFGVEILVFVQK